MRRRVIIKLAVAGAALAVVAVLAPGPVDQWRADRAWPVDQARAIAAVDAIQLPDAYTPTDCIENQLPAGTRCWVVTALPEDSLRDLRSVIATTGTDVQLSECGGPTTPEGPAACSIGALMRGTYDLQGFNFAVIRDFHAEAASRDDIWRDTSTVELAPWLTPPR